MLVACAVLLPVFCKVVIGTSKAMLWQFSFANPSLAPAFLKLPTSKAPPRSTKKGSSIGPQNTFSPEVDVVIAAVIKLL